MYMYLHQSQIKQASFKIFAGPSSKAAGTSREVYGFYEKNVIHSQSLLWNPCVHSALCFFVARSETSLGKALGTAPGALGPSLLDFITVCSTVALQDPCSCLICSTARSEERKCTWWAVEAPSHRENCDLKKTNILKIPDKTITY